MFKSYIECIMNATTIELENTLMKQFVKKYPEYLNYFDNNYNFFTHEEFLYHILNTDKIDPNGSTMWKGEYVKNFHLLLWALIENKTPSKSMKNAFFIFILKVRPDLIENGEFIKLLCYPHDKKNWQDYRYLQIQAALIDKFLVSFPEKRYIYSHLHLNSIHHRKFIEIEYGIEYKHDIFLSMLKAESAELKKAFPVSI